MHCGRPLRAARTILPATPDPDVCPLCQQKSARVKALAGEASHALARGLAPPKTPLLLKLFNADSAHTTGAAARASARANVTSPTLVASAARVSTVVIWTLAALGIVLLLLASNKVGSYRDLPLAVQHGPSLGAVIAARLAASLPFLLAAVATLTAAIGLLAVKLTADTLWGDTLFTYRRAMKNWDAAFYCPTDQIVFIRSANAVHWDPVRELRRLIAQDWSADGD
jgi:hypothetical protein